MVLVSIGYDREPERPLLHRSGSRVPEQVGAHNE